MNDGGRVRKEDRQTVVDGSRQSTVSRDGKAGDFAEGEGVSYHLFLGEGASIWTMWTVGPLELFDHTGGPQELPSL